MTIIHPLSEVGYTHASSVIALPRSREGESATDTQLLLPLKDSALPNRPPAAHVAPETVPVLPLPDRSVTLEPLPSSNEYAATRPGGVLLGGVAPPSAKAAACSVTFPGPEAWVHCTLM